MTVAPAVDHDTQELAVSDPGELDGVLEGVYPFCCSLPQKKRLEFGLQPAQGSEVEEVAKLQLGGLLQAGQEDQLLLLLSGQQRKFKQQRTVGLELLFEDRVQLVEWVLRLWQGHKKDLIQLRVARQFCVHRFEEGHPVFRRQQLEVVAVEVGGGRVRGKNLGAKAHRRVLVIDGLQ